jgi:hypothetical protein
MKKAKNYSRFYVLLKNISGDREEMKENLVRAFTNGRTMSLREMSKDEYNRMCDSLQGSQSGGYSYKEHQDEIKRRRSAVLKRMQNLGMNTNNWAEVDEFCLNPRIAGKRFSHLTLDDLKRMIPKLEAIAAKPQKQPQATPSAVDFWPYDRIMEYSKQQIPN